LSFIHIKKVERMFALPFLLSMLKQVEIVEMVGKTHRSVNNFILNTHKAKNRSMDLEKR